MENNTCEIRTDDNQVRYCAMIKDHMVSGYVWTNRFDGVENAISHVLDIVIHKFCFPSTFTENPSSVWKNHKADPLKAFASINWDIQAR